MEIRKFALGTMGANCYVLWDPETKDAAIIDPGYPDHRLADLIQTEGLHVGKILLTHGHFDHIGGLDYVRTLTDAPVYIHEDDASCITDAVVNLSLMVGTSMSFAPAEFLMRDGDLIEVGPTIRLKVIHTPGHTIGGVCFLGDEVLFTGDTLFEGSIGRTDFPGGDYDAIMTSLEKLLDYKDVTKVMTGHGSDSTLGRERRTNPFVRRILRQREL